MSTKACKDGKGKSKNRQSDAPKETKERQRAVKVTATEKDRVAILEFIGLHYDKLYDNIPEDYHAIINTANHFTDQKVAWIRKRILDVGNESIRNLASELDNYTVTFVFN